MVERYAANLVATGQSGDMLWTTVAGAARSARATRGQWSLEGEYVPLPFLAVGGRVENAPDGSCIKPGRPGARPQVWRYSLD